jgi:hypothetical protein
MTILFLDDYHVGDPLFLADLGRRLSKLGESGRTIILHRVEEAVSRALEDAGHEERPTVAERGVREVNQGIARRLIEEGVPAVSIQGSDRGLFRIEDETSSDVVVTGGSWLLQMIGTGTIPVVSPLAKGDGPGGVSVVDPVQCGVLLVELIRTANSGMVQCVVFCSNRKGGLFQKSEMIERIESSRLRAFDAVADIEAAERFAPLVDRMVATNSVSLAKGPVWPGTEIIP